MRMWNFAVLLFIFLIGIAANASVVHVSSEYPDQTDLSRKIKVNGSGLLFGHAGSGKFFVFTASHVSQGENLEIEFGSKKLGIVKRKLHDYQDLELIEVTGVTIGEIDAGYVSGAIVFRPDHVTRKRMIDSYNFVPLLPWIQDPNVEIDNAFAANRAPALYDDVMTGMLQAESLVQPGTSGAPLVTVVPDRSRWIYPVLPYDVREGIPNAQPGTVLVRGLAIRRDRFFARAGFIHWPWMSNLLADYLAGKPSQAAFKWKARAGILYREIEEYIETASTSGATAGGTTTDVGNGLTMDGGDLATLGEDSPEAFLEKVSALPLRSGVPHSLYMLVMRHPKTGAMISLWSWFDMEFYPRMKRFIFALQPSDGRPHDLVGDIGVRLNKATPYEITSPQTIKVEPILMTVRIADGSDVVEFKTNREGAQCKAVGDCKPKFQPVIEVTSRNGMPYIIDLREFFYVDFSRIRVPELVKPGAENLAWEDVMAKTYDQLIAEFPRIRLHYRRKRTSVEPMTVQQGQVSTVEWTR